MLLPPLCRGFQPAWLRDGAEIRAVRENASCLSFHAENSALVPTDGAHLPFALRGPRRAALMRMHDVQRTSARQGREQDRSAGAQTHAR
jgi:hypothetical protein